MVEMDEIEVKEKVPEKESKVLLVLTLVVGPVVEAEAVVSWWQLAFSFLLNRLDRRRSYVKAWLLPEPIYPLLLLLHMTGRHLFLTCRLANTSGSTRSTVEDASISLARGVLRDVDIRLLSLSELRVGIGSLPQDSYHIMNFLWARLFCLAQSSDCWLTTSKHQYKVPTLALSFQYELSLFIYNM